MIIRPPSAPPDRAARRAEALDARRTWRRRLRHRYQSPDHFHHISSRTVQGRFAFHQFDPVFTGLAWGVVAEATRRYHAQVAAFVLESNHFHALVKAPTAVAVSRWVQYVKSGLALLTHRWHGTRGTVWDGRYRCMTALDDDAEAGWFRYLLSHGVKNGLVADPRAWPGVHAARAVYAGEAVEGLRLDRRAWKRAVARDGGASMAAFARPITLKLAPLTAWHDAPDAWRGWARHTIDDIIAEHAHRDLPAAMDTGRYDALHIPKATKVSPCPRFDARGPAAAALKRMAAEAYAVGALHAHAQLEALLDGGTRADPRAAALYEGFQWPAMMLAKLVRPGEDLALATPARLSAGSLLAELRAWGEDGA